MNIAEIGGWLALVVSVVTIIAFVMQAVKSAKEKQAEQIAIGRKMEQDAQLKLNVDHAFEKLRIITDRLDKHESENTQEFHKLELKLNSIEEKTNMILEELRKGR